MKSKIFVQPFIIIIKLYQIIISPVLGPNCRYMPTCSEYAIDTFKSYGLIKGLYLSIKRISKCHPWGGQGYDPLPIKNEENKK